MSARRDSTATLAALLAVLMVAAILACLAPFANAASIPPQAERYRRELVRCAQYVFGLGAPIAVLAAQVHQESAWNPNARSAYASGLAQFTPATAKDMARLHPQELGSAMTTNPRWALLALCRYDARLLGMFTGASEADRWAFALAAYNGGPGWIIRDRAKAKAQGLDHLVWFGQVEAVNAGRGKDFWRENRDYPRRILLRHQALYREWGPGVDVSEVLQ